MSKKELYDEESAAAGQEEIMWTEKVRRKKWVDSALDKVNFFVGHENFGKNFASNMEFFKAVLPNPLFPAMSVGAAAGSGIALRVGRLVRETQEEVLTRGLTTVRAKDLWTVQWPIMKMKEGETNTGDEKCKEEVGKVTIVLDKRGFRAIQKIIGNSASFRRDSKDGGRISVSKPKKANRISANNLFKAGVIAAFPERANELEDLEVEHNLNSALGVSKAGKYLNQARYDFKTISFYTSSLNVALQSHSEAPTSGVHLARLQTQYTLNWNNEKVSHPLKCLAKFRKKGKATSPLKTLEAVHAERIDRIYEHHFSEIQMNKYRGSLQFVKSARHDWRLQRMADDDIKEVIKKRYKMPTPAEIAEQRKDFIRLVPIKREEQNKKRREKRKKKAEKKAKKAKKGHGSILQHFKPS